MKNCSLLTLTLILFAITATAQTEKAYKADHRFAYTDKVIENDVVSIEMKDIYAEATYCKFRFKVTNKTRDFVFVDPGKFKVDIGGREMGFTEKPFMVGPVESEAKTLNVKGEGGYHSESFSIDFADGFQKASAAGKPAGLEVFTLPASRNSVSNGPFKVNLLDSEQSTRRTVGEFELTYTGSDMAIVDASKISVAIPAGQKFANEISKSKPMVMEGAGTEKFTVIAEIPGKIADMQFTQLTVEWNDAIVESSKQTFSVEAVTFEVNVAKTAEINK